MKVEIKNRFNDKIILSGKYESIKDCLEKNRDADLSDSDLRGSDLRGSDLRGSNLRGSNLSGSDLRGSDLSCSDLRGSDLSYSNLRGSDLRGSDLRGSKNYSESHDFFEEIVRRQKVDTFTQKEWSIIGQIVIHKLCWESIRKRFNKSAMGIFKKLKKVGFGEWSGKYSEILREK